MGTLSRLAEWAAMVLGFMTVTAVDPLLGLTFVVIVGIVIRKDQSHNDQQ